MRLKGQAFETMMLVISVIVALAILGVLLNILGGISFGVGSAESVMQDGLKNVQSRGFGITVAKKATFEKDSLILKQSVIKDVPIPDDVFAFKCDDTIICSTNKLDVTESRIDAKARLDAYIVVCGDETRSPLKYCVGLGSSELNARTACTTKCDIATT